MALPKLSAAAAGAALTLALPAAALAGPPGKWTQVTGFGTPDPNTLEASVARSADGVLHVSWTRADSSSAETLLHSSVSANAKTVGGPQTVYTYSDGANNDSVVLVTPEGLRMFFAGLARGNALCGALATSVSTDGGATWSPAEAVSDVSSAGKKSVYAATGIAAARLNDGNFLSAWGAPGSGLHVGLDPSNPDGALFEDSPVDTGVGVDSQSGQAIVAANLLDADGVAYATPGGARTVIPNSGAAQLQHQVGVTGRIGAPGLFVAYTQGTSEFLGSAAVWNVATGKGTRLGRKGDQRVSIAAAPDGRLWVFWYRPNPGKAVYATRSNPEATKFGRVVKVNAPKGTESMFDLVGEGSRGPLDVLLLADTGSLTANWHQRILPGLSLTAKVGKGGKVTFKASDAGDPVKGAKVALKGNGSKTTRANGTVTFILDTGRYRAKASKPGYSPATARARLR